MDNKTKKALLLGLVILLCGVVSLVSSLLGQENKAVKLLSKNNLEGTSFREHQEYRKSDNTTTNKTMKIYVSGAVVNPGLYDISLGARADDAVRLAGGMLENADPQRINLALKLKDGMQVNVPFIKSKRTIYGSNKSNKLTMSNYGEINGERGREAINLNTATAKELEALPGIGASMAQKIINYRQQNKFSKVEELAKVPGIGRAKLERLRNYVCV